jgi:Arc/MetJ-type ribon-helix-helix transcriptional regulator
MPRLVTRSVKLPEDWIARIDARREGDAQRDRQTFSEFVREAIRRHLNVPNLPPPATPGRPAG